jgi:hypothetical protein
MRSHFTPRHLLIRTLFVVMACMACSAQAMTPGPAKRAWDPAVIAQLTPQQVRALKAAKCDVVGYRNEDPEGHQGNESDKPGEQDTLMLATGEFGRAGQKDLVALCLSTENEQEFFFVVWGGPAQCDSTLMMSRVSRYWKTRDASLDYYGSRLGVVPLADLRKPVAAPPAQSESETGTTKTWYLKPDKSPVFNHDAFSLDGNYSVTYYCTGKRWMPLYDSFSTEMD